MRRPAVFFDRDNTLIVGNDYLGDPAGVVLVAGAATAVAGCRDLGFAVVVVSNQSGVARGMFTEADVQAVDRRMAELLLAGNPHAVVDRHEYCPFHPDGSVMEYRQESDRRKPRPGMIVAAAEAMALDLPASWVIGDAPRDVAAGRAAGCRTILIIDPTLPPSPAALASSDVTGDFTVGSLTEAVAIVTRSATSPPTPASPKSTQAPPSPPAETPPLPFRDSADVAPSPTTPPPGLPPGPPPFRETRPTAAASLSPMSVPPTSVPPMPLAPVPAPTPSPSVAPVARIAPSGSSAPPAARPVATALAAAAARPKAVAGDKPPVVRLDTSRLEAINQQVLMELKKFNDAGHDDFSISKLIAGIVQTLALAALPVAYVLYRNDPVTLQSWLLAAIFLQAFTVALLVMGRQR